eukprot:32563-Chlamydomonas_euryale.AAC.2
MFIEYQGGATLALLQVWGACAVGESLACTCAFLTCVFKCQGLPAHGRSSIGSVGSCVHAAEHLCGCSTPVWLRMHACACVRKWRCVRAGPGFPSCSKVGFPPVERWPSLQPSRSSGQVELGCRIVGHGWLGSL